MGILRIWRGLSFKANFNAPKCENSLKGSVFNKFKMFVQKLNYPFEQTKNTKQAQRPNTKDCQLMENSQSLKFTTLVP